MESTSQQTRWYFLKASDKLSHQPSLYLFGALTQEEKNYSKIENEFSKALESGYNKVLLPWNVFCHSKIQNILNLISKTPHLWAIQIHQQTLKHHKKNLDSLISKKQLTFDFVFENYNQELSTYIDALSQNINFQITVLAHKNTKDINHTIQTLKNKYVNKSHIHFPYFHKKHPELYSSAEAFRILQKNYLPPPQIDIYNLSIPKDLKLEPDANPEIFYKSNDPNILISVIIPSYNSKKSLLLNLEHLENQNLEKNNWEVIVVDDGSFDGTGDFLKQCKFLSNWNFKYLYFPRAKKRRLMDFTFRAGIARNLGVKHANGKYLSFLDSDIITPENYLSSSCKELAQNDVIQHPRLHLKKTSPTNYKKINKDNHVFTGKDIYWENFYNSTQNWNTRKMPWKYISTNTLCLKTEVFKRVGWFRKNYTCYGFEDTDLGWRLYQNGYQFKLNRVDTYHVYRNSEFFHINLVKSHLLSYAASLFFHNTHSLESYQEFKHLIERTYFINQIKKIFKRG